MSDGLSETAIVDAVARQASRRIARKVIRTLQAMTDKLSGDDSELKTTWDEICVQVQYEHSVFWDACDETVLAMIAEYVKKLPKHEPEAIWLQTDAAIHWDKRGPDNQKSCPVSDEDIADHIAREYIYTEAGRWSNARIRAYIDRSIRRD